MSKSILVNPYQSDVTLKKRIASYTAWMKQMTSFLEDNPDEWGLFQSEFNQEITGIFRDLMLFERAKFECGEEDQVYKLKNLFIRRFRNVFACGEYVKWCIDKPRGYAGDYKIIDDIYENKPRTVGVGRLFDNYFMMSPVSVAVRNRKNDFKSIALDTIARANGKPVKIMVLASGPARDIYEILQEPSTKDAKVSFLCLEADTEAIAYARQLLKEDARVTFKEMNVVRLALMSKVEEKMDTGFDLIYSTGLFDYLDFKISVRLISNLKLLVKAGGKIAISDVYNKYSNPSIYFMEWVGDWNLIYRDHEEFREIFLNSGFSKDDLQYGYEQQGIMQYIIALTPPARG